jgi:hypothetical protein
LNISIKEKNSFKEMNFIKFWLVSSLFFITFPVSLVFCFLYLGSLRTKHLIKALIDDILQTILIIILLLSAIIYFLINYLSMYFS